jgi:ribosome biogenesis GTPase
MVPKFKGDSDDWLDDEDSSGGAGKGSARSVGQRPKKIQARALGLPLDQANGVVAEVFPNQCRVRMDVNQQDLLCTYRRAGVVSKSKDEMRERTPVAVGDRVLVNSTSSTTGVIEGICQRKNRISRPAPGRETEKLQHVLAANIDLMVVVASCREPEFSPGLVDRFLVAAEAEGVSACLCITKIDLQESQSVWKIYQDIGYPVFEVSSKKELGLAQLRQTLEAKTVVFCGHSGVGKTSLLRSILGSSIGKVGEVSGATGKGRHTTTGATLLNGPEGSRWIDTPGIREFGLMHVVPENLSQCFPEFQKVQCSQSHCLHLDEPQCGARELKRYSSYRRILESLLAGEN